MRFRGGAIPQNRLEPVLNELVNGRTNELVKSSELISIALLNATNKPCLSPAGPSTRNERNLSRRASIGATSVTLVNPVDLGASLLRRRHQSPSCPP